MTQTQDLFNTDRQRISGFFRQMASHRHFVSFLVYRHFESCDVIQLRDLKKYAVS